MSTGSFFLYAAMGAFAAVAVAIFEDRAEERAYARGIKDCQAGTPSYTVIVQNGVADTTYTYPSK